MCLSLIISVSTSSSGDSEDCSCPYDNLSATVNQLGLPYPSLAYILHMWPPWLWQVCRWHVTHLYSSHQQMHIALTLTYYVVVHLWQRSCHLLATSDQIILLSLVHALYVRIKRSQCTKWKLKKTTLSGTTREEKRLSMYLIQRRCTCVYLCVSAHPENSTVCW